MSFHAGFGGETTALKRPAHFVWWLFTGVRERLNRNGPAQGLRAVLTA
jgi:hypothetical protein